MPQRMYKHLGSLAFLLAIFVQFVHSSHIPGFEFSLVDLTTANQMTEQKLNDDVLCICAKFLASELELQDLLSMNHTSRSLKQLTAPLFDQIKITSRLDWQTLLSSLKRPDEFQAGEGPNGKIKHIVLDYVPGDTISTISQYKSPSVLLPSAQTVCFTKHALDHLDLDHEGEASPSFELLEHLANPTSICLQWPYNTLYTIEASRQLMSSIAQAWSHLTSVTMHGHEGLFYINYLLDEMGSTKAKGICFRHYGDEGTGFPLSVAPKGIYVNTGLGYERLENTLYCQTVDVGCREIMFDSLTQTEAHELKTDLIKRMQEIGYSPSSVESIDGINRLKNVSFCQATPGEHCEVCGG